MDFIAYFNELEKTTLSSNAQLSVNSRGREREITPCEMRTCYMRDYDRILHCKSFRRLKHKTQVFFAPEGDHYRTRLTHTLEVCQIARSISRLLRLNENLTEAIALGHDLGHTPFGHAGEHALAQMTGGFEHNIHSLRVVEVLENGCGLNLTWEVRDGIKNHKKGLVAATWEGMSVNYADRIAYLNHDIDDAIRAGLIRVSDIPKLCLERFGETHGDRINYMISDVVYTTMERGVLAMSEQTQTLMDELREFMFKNVYFHPSVQREREKAEGVVRTLYDYFTKNPDRLPPEMEADLNSCGVVQAVTDYIAGMTDGYAIRTYEEIFVPSEWGRK